MLGEAGRRVYADGDPPLPRDDTVAQPAVGGGLTKLRYVRVYLDHDDSFSVDALPQHEHLRGLDLDSLPAGPWGYSGLAKKAPGLDSLVVKSRHDVVLDRKWPRPLDTLRITGKRIEGDPIPSDVRSLSLHLSEADDAHVEQLLANLRSVTHLGLRGTRVSDTFVEPLLRRWSLEYIDVVDTRVSEDCVRRIAARYPKLRMHPRLDVEV